MAYQKHSDNTNSNKANASDRVDQSGNPIGRDTDSNPSNVNFDEQDKADRISKSTDSETNTGSKDAVRGAKPNDDGKAQALKHKQNKEDEERDKKSKEEENKQEKKFGKNVARKGTETAAAYGVKSFLAMQLANALKMLMLLLMQMMNALASAIGSVVAAVVHFVASIAVAFGVTMMTAAIGLTGFFCVGVAVVTTAVASSEQVEGKADTNIPTDPCAGREDKKYEAVNMEDTDMEARAKMVWDFFGNYYTNTPKEKVAGMLGNWQVESNITFMMVEGSPSTEQMVKFGSDEKALDVYTSGTLFPHHYSGRHWSAQTTSYSHLNAGTGGGRGINSAAYIASYNGKTMFVPGMGIGQWTGQRGKDLINLANGTEFEWYDAQIQLAYMVSIDSRAQWIADWNKETTGNPRDGAKTFGFGWEGDISDTLNARQNNAETWFVKIAGWEADVNFYNTIMDIAGDAAVLAAGANNAKNHEDGCTETTLTYGDTVAERMSAYCWDSHDQSCADFTQAWIAKGRPRQLYGDPAHWIDSPIGVECGTDLYKKVHSVVAAGDTLWASCDRSVACAVRWAGLDDNFPLGGCGTLIDHMKTSSRWENVTSSIHSESDLQPGDILIKSTHVIMYLGSDAVLKYHPDAQSNWLYGSGSFGDRPPNVQGDTWNNYTYVFRNVKPEENSIYFNAVE